MGWRLNYDCWGKGLTTEAAKEALRIGFDQISLDEIVSFTTVKNQRSISVMEKLKMIKSLDFFNHPAIPEGHVLSKHVLYRLSKKSWIS